MSAGLFRDVVDIYDDSSDDTEEQQAYQGLPFLNDVPAQIEHVAGHERGQDTFVRYSVKFHYIDGITEEMRVSVTEGPFVGDDLNIEEVALERVRGRPMWTVLNCIKVF